MLNVDSLTPARVPTPSTAYFKAAAKVKKAVPPPARLIEMTFRSVELDGRNLWRECDEVAISQLAEAVRLADLRGKSELMINDITPWIAVGHVDSRQVPVLQKRIQARLEAACKQLKRGNPECRLDLTGGRYSIRCYLGRTKPTDHIFNEDLVSDSR